MNEHLRIGDLAKLFHLDVQTLRLYEEKGLLFPEGREEGSNYRFYRADRVYPLALIRYLRRLDCPLTEIHNFMKQRSFTETCSYLRHQSETLHTKIQEMLLMDTVIQMKIEFTEQELKDLRPEKISKEYYQEIRYIELGNFNDVFSNEQFYLYPTLAFYQNNELSFGAYLISEPLEDYGKSIHSIPEGNYLTAYHSGPYSKIEKTFRRMRNSTKLPLFQNEICINIIDQFVEVNPENYITKVLIKVIEC